MRAGTNLHREEKDLIREELSFWLEPLEYLQVHAGHPHACQPSESLKGNLPNSPIKVRCRMSRMNHLCEPVAEE